MVNVNGRSLLLHLFLSITMRIRRNLLQDSERTMSQNWQNWHLLFGKNCLRRKKISTTRFLRSQKKNTRKRWRHSRQNIMRRSKRLWRSEEQSIEWTGSTRKKRLKQSQPRIHWNATHKMNKQSNDYTPHAYFNLHRHHNTKASPYKYYVRIFKR